MIAPGFIHIKDQDNNDLLINTEKITFIEASDVGTFIWLVDGMKIITSEDIKSVNHDIYGAKNEIFKSFCFYMPS